MKVFNKKEAFVIAYEIYTKRRMLSFDSFLSMFHLEDDPAVRGTTKNPCDCGIIVDKETGDLLENIFSQLDKKSTSKKPKQDLHALKLWAKSIDKSMGVPTKAKVHDLYVKLKTELEVACFKRVLGIL